MLEEESKRRIARTWAYRARAEIEAAARFARLAAELEQIRAAPVVIRGALQAANDERRHAEMCAELARLYGIPGTARHVPPRVRVGRAHLSARDRLLWELVSVCCIGETMNTSLLTVTLEVAGDETVRNTVRELLRDEVNHARLGWAHLAAECAAGNGSFIADTMPLMLESSVEPNFFMPHLDEVDLSHFGELSHPARLSIFEHTLNEVILPGVEALGIDSSPSRAWLAKQLAGAHRS